MSVFAYLLAFSLGAQLRIAVGILHSFIIRTVQREVKNSSLNTPHTQPRDRYIPRTQYRRNALPAPIPA